MSQCHDLYEWIGEPSAEKCEPVTQCHDVYPQWTGREDRLRRDERARSDGHRRHAETSRAAALAGGLR